MKNKNNLLFIIDMQKGFEYPNVLNLIENINFLQEKFKGDIIYTKFKNKINSNFVKELNWKKFIKKTDCNFLEKLNFDRNNKIIIHSKYSILNEDLKKIIKNKNYSNIYIAGIYTDVCIFKLAIDLFDINIKVKIIADCISSQNSLENDFFINSLSRIIGKKNIINLEDL